MDDDYQTKYQKTREHFRERMDELFSEYVSEMGRIRAEAEPDFENDGVLTSWVLGLGIQVFNPNARFSHNSVLTRAGFETRIGQSLFESAGLANTTAEVFADAASFVDVARDLEEDDD